MKLRNAWVGLLAGSLSVAGSAFAGISGSKHDMESFTGVTTNAQGEVCVFCHTPHGSDTGAGAPLWNKRLPDATTFTRYSSLGTATLDGAEVAVGSVSLACLSCHDGSQARDVVLNAPGNGGHTAAGAPIGGGTIGILSGSPIPALGKDLRDDHPISIAYAGGACTNVLADCNPATASTGDPDFATAQYATINGQNQWWVDVNEFSLLGDGSDTNNGVVSTREKTDMILYTRDFGGNDGPSVECASCHDPHEDAARPVSFLRISNANSDVCLACHIK